MPKKYSNKKLIYVVAIVFLALLVFAYFFKSLEGFYDMNSDLKKLRNDCTSSNGTFYSDGDNSTSQWLRCKCGNSDFNTEDDVFTELWPSPSRNAQSGASNYLTGGAKFGCGGITMERQVINDARANAMKNIDKANAKLKSVNPPPRKPKKQDQRKLAEKTRNATKSMNTGLTNAYNSVMKDQVKEVQ